MRNIVGQIALETARFVTSTLRPGFFAGCLAGISLACPPLAANQFVKGPGVDARALPAWGIYARNVQALILEDVRFSLTEDDTRPVIYADRVERLNLDGFRFTQVPGVTEPLVATNGGRIFHLTPLNREAER